MHLVGSTTTPELAELSRLYARGALEATADPADEQLIALVEPGGGWRFPASLDEDAPLVPIELAPAWLHGLAPSVVVPHLFCLPGMTTYRALLEVLGIPYVGNRPDVMANTAHKERARAIVSAAGVDVPRGEVVRPGDPVAIEAPLVVKPTDSDNSVGVALVRDCGDLDEALTGAFAHSSTVLVEEFVPLGREVRCGVVERSGELVVLPLEEYAVDAERKPVRDAADKLARTTTGELRLVAKDAEHAWIVDASDPVIPAVAAAARACYQALGCRHYGLFDFRIDPSGRPWFLEAGLYCSFSPSSVLAVMAAAGGIPVTTLFSELVALAI